MLCKLAWGNVRRAGKDYLVYLLTLTLAVTVFYAFNTIGVQIDYVMLDDAGLGDMIGEIMGGLTIFLAVVMGFLMVYANNFIMKRRKKEFGLYQVFGMSRGQIARVMALETAIVSAAALVLGLVLGVVFSQLMTFFTASLFRTQIANFHFVFSARAVLTTVACLVAIFLVTLLFNLRVAGRSKIVDLMSSGRRSERVRVRNPWISAAIFVTGAVLIGVSYARLLHDGLPVDGTNVDAMKAFEITTLMVVAGTLLFFFGFSGFLLRVLQTARGLYWRGLNMFTMRQLSAKVNTVSFSMCMIAMILFLAITSVTGGMSIVSVMNSALDRCVPADASIGMMYFGPGTTPGMREAYSDSGRVLADEVHEPVDLIEDAHPPFLDESALKQEGGNVNLDKDAPVTGELFDARAVSSDLLQLDQFDTTPTAGAAPMVTLQKLCAAADMPLPPGISSAPNEPAALAAMKESDYNRYLKFRGKKPVDLGGNGYLLTSDMGASVEKVYDEVLKRGVTIPFAGVDLQPRVDALDKDAGSFENSTMGSNPGCIIVPDELIERTNLPLYRSTLLIKRAEGVSQKDFDDYFERPLDWPVFVDGEGRSKALAPIILTRSEAEEAGDGMNGMVSYLAIYIGFVLVVACAAILAIQQLSGVADSGRSYRVLSELGTSRSEIMRSVLAQQAVFFLFPLVVGVAHSLVAMHVVIEVVELFGHMEIGPTVGLTCLVFLLCYGGYFLVTYFMSAAMVKDAIGVRHGA